MPRARPTLLLAILLILPCLHAKAQVKRCAAPGGGVIYTDRNCEDIGSTELLPMRSDGAGVYASRPLRTTCARSVQDLAYSLGSAIQSGDVNQVAGVYDWTGTSSSTGYRLMTRLEAIARRPLVDVQPMYAGGTNEYGYDVVEFDPETGEVISKPPRKPRLIGLRVEQTLANGSTPSRTVFGLRQHFGCWWVRL